MKKKYTEHYFNYEEMINKYPDMSYYIAFGEREDGKSYSAKQQMLKSNLRGKRFVLVRRKHKHIVNGKLVRFFDDFQKEYIKKYDSEIYYDNRNKIYYILNNGERIIMGYVCAIEEVMDDKGFPYDNIEIVFFDEFIDYDLISEQEISKFLNLISNICRGTYTNVKILMAGNTISKNSCKYFELFGFNPSKMRQGEYYIVNHKLGVKAVAVHTATRVKDIRTKTKHHKYIGFDDNESVKMIMFGDWEYITCVTKNIDGITWSNYRHLLPIYITFANKVFELSLYTDGVPVAFLRDINTQCGKVSNLIKYNFKIDDSVVLINKKGIVPSVFHINSLIDNATLKKIDIFRKCVDSGRIIFNNQETGTDFYTVINAKF